MKTKVLILILFNFAAVLSCSETNISPLVVVPSAPDISTLKPVHIVFEGELADDRDWLKSFAISRLFSHDVPNRSGSMIDLLLPALEPALTRKGYRSDNAASETLRIIARERLVHWYPPQEFIQTVRPHRRGRILIHLNFEVIYADGSTFPFERKIEGEAYPGKEIERVESLIGALLAEFQLGMLDRLPAPKRTAP